jgi:hypothetical protein
MWGCVIVSAGQCVINGSDSFLDTSGINIDFHGVGDTPSGPVDVTIADGARIASAKNAL